MAKRAAGLLWHYALRWSLPHKPCPGAEVLASAEVSAGERCPPQVLGLWKPGTGYAIHVDFAQSAAVRRWTSEQKATVRQRNLVQRVQKAAPLFADELVARELAARPGYFAGQPIDAEPD